MALRLRLDKPWRPLTADVVDRLPGQLGVYQIADANEAMHPQSLTAVPGRRLTIPLPLVAGGRR